MSFFRCAKSGIYIKITLCYSKSTFKSGGKLEGDEIFKNIYKIESYTILLNSERY